MNSMYRSTITTATDNICHGLRCFHGKKGGQKAFLGIFTGAPSIHEAFGFLYEIIIVGVWDWFFAHRNHGEGCCSIAMGWEGSFLVRELPNIRLGVVASLSYL